MHKYRLYYLADNDDANWKHYESDTEVKVGDILQLACGLFHYVSAIQRQKTGVRLDLSKSGQDEAEARLLAEQYGHR